MKKSIYLFAALLILMGCNRQQTPLTLHWELIANDVEPGICEAALTITNTGTEVLSNNGWLIGFGLMSLHPIYTVGDELRETEVQASYHTLTPTESFQVLEKGCTRTYKLRYKGSAVRESSHPEGFFLVYTDAEDATGKPQQPISIPCSFAPYTRMNQMTRGIETWLKTPYADGEYMYTYINERKGTGEHGESLNEHGVTQKSAERYPYFPQPKQMEFGTEVRSIDGLEREVTTDPTLPAEGYTIQIDDEKILITVADDDGFQYAMVTLEQLGNESNVTFVRDWPDYHFRAVMLDISRNFYTMEDILLVINQMAALKLNVLHLHLADDEGWRIEIPALPQLTANGSCRGYTTDESDCLYPAYCGGWDKNDSTSTANGYLTREDYVWILEYAKQRNIRIIPEIDMPGHMRAIKKAMGDVLVDPELEKREYLSAQNYTDNVIAVTREEALPTIRTIIEAFVDMHNEAGCPLTVFNIGGDEVPKGALTHEEHQAFIDGVLAILKEYNLQPAGWEEIDHFCTPASGAICYSWHPGEKKAREMAEKGFPVVLAAADHLYFDFAYCHQHEEKGLNWGGYTDEFSSFDWQPLEHKNVIGMSAQLWAEVIRSFDQVEWQLYPKMFGLSERAWNAHSALSVTEYGDLVYNTALPRLAREGCNFHLMQPGIHIGEDRMVSMNSITDKGVITYSIRLDEGKELSGKYDQPFLLPEKAEHITAQWHYLDHHSNTTHLFIERQ